MAELETSLNTEKLDSGSERLIHGIGQDTFNGLNDELKGRVILGHNNVLSKAKDGGWIGTVIGTNIKNATINGAFVLIFLLFLCCALDMVMRYRSSGEFKYELYKMVLPVITLALGYIFGKK